MAIWLVSRVAVMPSVARCTLGKKWCRSTADLCACTDGSKSSATLALEKSTRASSRTRAALYANSDGLLKEEVARSLGSVTPQKSLVRVMSQTCRSWAMN